MFLHTIQMSLIFKKKKYTDIYKDTQKFMLPLGYRYTKNDLSSLYNYF